MANKLDNLKKAKGFDKIPENINKEGRPKGTKNRSTILRKWLEAQMKITNPITKQQENMSVEDSVMLALINKALKGDVAAIREILDTNYGKIADKTDITTNGKDLTQSDYDLSKLSVEALKELKNAKVSGK